MVNLPGHAATDVAACERQYLNSVMETCSKVDLLGISPNASKERCRNLAAIYTALRTQNAEDDEKRSNKQRFRSAVEWLNAEKRLVLLGDPGSGKSTFVKFVALCLAGERAGDPCVNRSLLTAPMPDEKEKDKQPAPQPWQHGALLPVIIVLREFAATALPADNAPVTIEHLFAYLREKLRAWGIEEFAPALKSILWDGKALLLFDGLDEVPEAQRRRQQILDAIRAAAMCWKGCRILVTSRTYAYQPPKASRADSDQNASWRLDGFAETVLATFDEKQIAEFVTRWYEEMAEHGQLASDFAKNRAEALQKAIDTRAQLRQLAERPLLLTLMAVLHSSTGTELPDKRVELYARATEVLLEWWEGYKQHEYKSLSEVLNIGRDKLLEALSRIAFEAHARQPLDTDAARVADIPQEKIINELYKLNSKEIEEAKAHLNQRAGLLVAQDGEIYTFPHRSFQEYLAAYYLHEHKDDPPFPFNIVELVKEDHERWREVVLLSVQMCTATGIWEAVEQLCPEEVEDVTEVRQADAYCALFAAHALYEKRVLFEATQNKSFLNKKKRLKKWLKAILTEGTAEPCQGLKPWQGCAPLPARERALAGNLLAEFGDDRPGVGLRADGTPWIEWRDIPAGTFLMGSDPQRDPYFEIPYPNPEYAENFKKWIQYELPQHPVTLPAFRISRYPITNAQFQAFVDDGGYREEKFWTETGGWKIKEQKGWNGRRRFQDERFALPNHPAVAVSWYEAMAFCAWLTRNTSPPTPSPNLGEGDQGGEVFRLPTEAEWEYAARGTDGRLFAFGNELTPEFANYADTNLGATSAVGAFPRGKSAFGCDDMTGNVWEWCLNQDYRYSDGEPSFDEIQKSLSEEKTKVLRGGAWYYSPLNCRCAYRHWYDPDPWGTFIGFRVVVVSRTL